MRFPIKIMVLIGLLAASPLRAQSLSCANCAFFWSCRVDECNVVELCVVRGTGGAGQCWVDQFGFCRTSDNRCLLAEFEELTPANWLIAGNPVCLPAAESAT